MKIKNAVFCWSVEKGVAGIMSHPINTLAFKHLGYTDTEGAVSFQWQNWSTDRKCLSMIFLGIELIEGQGMSYDTIWDALKEIDEIRAWRESDPYIRDYRAK
jgi:hypothetical protein